MIQIGAPPDAGFDRPVQMLSDCHRRIERFLAGFAQVATTVSEALTTVERATLAAAIAYFETSGPRHTQDEDESLFPRLAAHAGDPRVQAVQETVAILEGEHTLAHVHHERAQALGRRWLETGLTGAERDELRALLGALQEIYRRHILLEDVVVFPLADAVLTDAEKAAMGQEMARRRGISLPEIR